MNDLSHSTFNDFTTLISLDRKFSEKLVNRQRLTTAYPVKFDFDTFGWTSAVLRKKEVCPSKYLRFTAKKIFSFDSKKLSSAIY